MTRELLLNQLRQGQTGEQILDILNAIIDDSDVSLEPTTEEIDF